MNGAVVSTVTSQQEALEFAYSPHGYAGLQLNWRLQIARGWEFVKVLAVILMQFFTQFH